MRYGVLSQNGSIVPVCYIDGHAQSYNVNRLTILDLVEGGSEYPREMSHYLMTFVAILISQGRNE